MRNPQFVLPDSVAEISGDLCAMEPLEGRRLALAKAVYTTRFVARLTAADPRGFGLVAGEHVVPQAGDVALARVVRLGQHVGIERPDGYKASLFEGDEILVAYGDRYAPDQFEAVVPDNLGPAHLVAAGGLIGTVISSHSTMRTPTQIEPLGLLADARGTMTLQRCAPFKTVGPQDAQTLRRVGKPLVVGVLGTSMTQGRRPRLPPSCEVCVERVLRSRPER